MLWQRIASISVFLLAIACRPAFSEPIPLRFYDEGLSGPAGLGLSSDPFSVSDVSHGLQLNVGGGLLPYAPVDSAQSFNGAFRFQMGVAAAPGASGFFDGPFLIVEGQGAGTLDGPRSGPGPTSTYLAYDGTATSVQLVPASPGTPIPAWMTELINHPSEIHIKIANTPSDYRISYTTTLVIDPPSSIPEPTSLALFLAGLGGLTLRRRGLFLFTHSLGRR